MLWKKTQSGCVMLMVLFQSSFYVFFLCRFSILYIQSFVYTVYDELAGQRKGPGSSGKSAASCHSHIPTTEANTGEPLHVP